ncbi:4-hydroxy-tetrahydrodipicolinate reductase [Occallatibacter riparius]|uniref:4-hydroxy-tetrahydrodipicolinate reductase n=1 Tax=Occallatibacter riparius TaxID=1002689 RepID=A0A9J7BPZ7_9BACT|nr:dihydrodipicolinate reductase C-terminal domain-containing protein [Occallatibacter riparius]UWZ83818.1 4-hydroxy-tetrahydrodipicolinate reductase [Occallatibacter riparius]
MLFLVLGKGKTGSLVAEIAHERGHGVRALDINENRGASALTAPTLAGVDTVIDFTSAEAAVQNMRAVLALGSRIVVGTTGWYAHLDEMRSKAQKRGALLYGTNFSIGVQKLFRLTAELARLDGYQFSISETHHNTKLDAPSGTALTLQEIIHAARPGSYVPITSHRVGDAKGEHIVTANSDIDVLELRHDAASRRGFALGAVRAAEWLAKQQPGAYDFRDIFDQL